MLPAELNHCKKKNYNYGSRILTASHDHGEVFFEVEKVRFVVPLQFANIGANVTPSFQ